MRIGVFVAATLWLAPVLAVGCVGLGMPIPIAALCGLAAGGALAAVAARPLAACLSPALAGRPLLAAIALLTATAAVAQIGRLSVFMVDSSRETFSSMPGDPWRTRHCCLTSYAEAARFVNGGVNIYDAELYEPRHLGPLKVDTYHYPPPFLLAPAAFRLVTGGDFFRLRDLWFAMQALVLAAAVSGVALWIGGLPGAYALLTGVAFLGIPLVLFALQMGNFQTTAVSMALVGTVLLLTARITSGALLLAYVAASKIFPGILIVYLAMARKWRAVAWVAGAGAVLLLLTLGVFGTRPFLDFVRYEVPAISSGAAFPQSERPSVVSVNQSIYGVTVRLRLLGLRALDQPTGLRIASVYGLMVVAFAAFAGWMGRRDLTSPAGRANLLLAVLGLLTLASFRSPFVGGGYGLISTFWTLALLTAVAPARSSRLLWLFAFAVFATSATLTPSAAPTNTPTTFWLAVSAALVAFAVGVGAWAVVRGTVLQRVETARPAPSQPTLAARA